jgi:hypothetical protein
MNQVIGNAAKTIALMSALMSAQSALADQKIQVWGRGYHHSCGYYSSTDADFDVTIFNDAIPYGASVTLVSGFGSDNLNRNPYFAHWQYRTEQKMEAIDVSTWRIRKSGQINARSSQSGYSQIEFVFRIDVPGQPSQWILPGANGSYYIASLEYMNIRCVNSDEDMPGFSRLNLKSGQ